MSDKAETAAIRLWRDRVQLREQERNEAQARARIAEEKVAILSARQEIGESRRWPPSTSPVPICMASGTTRSNPATAQRQRLIPDNPLARFYPRPARNGQTRTKSPTQKFTLDSNILRAYVRGA